MYIFQCYTGTFGFSYGSSLGHSLHLPSQWKSFNHFKKESTPTFIEKYVAVPVHVKVPVDRPVPVPKLWPVTVEKAVPVPYKVSVPQPYPVIKKVPFPVKVPVDRPVPVQVLKPYPVYVEKQVPYPVDKPVPVPVKVPVDRPYPVYVAVEKPTTTTTTTEKPVFMMAMPAGLKWSPDKTFSLPSGKSLAWLDKPDSSSFLRISGSEEYDNEKLVSSLFETPESVVESEISWPENMPLELEVKK